MKRVNGSRQRRNAVRTNIAVGGESLYRLLAFGLRRCEFIVRQIGVVGMVRVVGLLPIVGCVVSAVVRQVEIAVVYVICVVRAVEHKGKSKPGML